MARTKGFSQLPAGFVGTQLWPGLWARLAESKSLPEAPGPGNPAALSQITPPP